MSLDPAAATMWCFTCGLKVPTDSEGRILEHENKKRQRCLQETPYTEPAAHLIGWGVADTDERAQLVPGREAASD